MSHEHEPSLPSTSRKSRCTRQNKTATGTTPARGPGICLETRTAEGTFGWLRGVDLNHRPLGYEPKLNVHGCSRMFAFHKFTPELLASSYWFLLPVPLFCYQVVSKLREGFKSRSPRKRLWPLKDSGVSICTSRSETLG